ncbi:MAG: hypothetical protein NTV52_29530 [Acidobacteria bacterium]|nr:hypothetical protein [Acidobacteriota bacterium]
MKPATWSLADLEIIGYADDRDQTMLPAIVPPVFRSISNPDVVLVPPFAVRFDVVARATELSFAEAESLPDRREVTLFFGAPLVAQPDHELWLRRNGEVVYQPALEARRELDHLCKLATQRARIALAAGDMASAEAAASKAILSNDRSVAAFAIKAAIRRKLGKPAGERLMAELAGDLLDLAAFHCLVNHYRSSVPALSAPPVEPLLGRRSPMKDMATFLPHQ